MQGHFIVILVKQAIICLTISPAQIVLARTLREIAHAADTLGATGVGLRMLRTARTRVRAREGLVGARPASRAHGLRSQVGVLEAGVADTLLRARGPGRRRRVRRTALLAASYVPRCIEAFPTYQMI